MDNELKAPSLSEHALEQARALVGMDVRLEQWNYEASRDSIRHYAWGIGDDNPLYCDPVYAATTRWGGIIAPPTFLMGICEGLIAPGLPDIQWFGAGREFYFDRPIRRGEEIKVAGRYVGAREAGGGHVERMVLQTGEVDYLTLEGERVGMVRTHAFRVARKGADSSLKYQPRAAHRYSDEDLTKIEAAVLAEFRRGGDTLYWNDVEVGEAMPGTLRGPLTLMDMTCYYAGAVGTPGYKSTKLRWQYKHWAHHAPENLPNTYDPSYFGAAIVPSIGHQDAKVASSELGMPGAYDNGAQRVAFLSTCATNWMGDDGFLREIKVRFKLPVIFGDTLYTKGKVTAKSRRGAVGVIEADIWGENQLGDVVATGQAVIELPLRDAG